MLGSKKRDYKKEHVRTMERIGEHKARTEELMKKEGLSRKEASRKAFEEMTGMLVVGGG